MNETTSTRAVTGAPARTVRARAIDRWALAGIARGLRGCPVRLALWDGTERFEGTSRPVARVVFRDRAALLGVLLRPDLAFGDAYSAGTLDVEGDLGALLEAAFRRSDPANESRGTARRRRNTPRRSRENVHRHYDLGNDFFSLWLDEEMVYTCAYFPTPDISLEGAQRAKMDLVCRKLRLQPGERVVEAGCGWGALALHMARHHGVTVKAYNVSREQIRHARRRATDEGLDGRVEFIEEDYRRIEGRFDAFVSIGMLEHVGPENFDALSGVIDRVVDGRHGRGLLHFIGRNRRQPLNPWIERRIFPGAYPPTLAEVVERVVEPAGFSVTDVENLRLHYAATLDHWRDRFESAFDRVAARNGLSSARAWRLYLAGSGAAFRTGWLHLFQIVFERGRDDGLPRTRPV